METIIKNLEDKSVKTISVLKEDLNTVRAGRANPALLDKIMVNYYGMPTPLKNISKFRIPEHFSSAPSIPSPSERSKRPSTLQISASIHLTTASASDW